MTEQPQQNPKLSEQLTDALLKLLIVGSGGSSLFPSKERVYPQHLIGTAIELLRAQDVDWSQVKNVEDLREQLNF